MSRTEASRLAIYVTRDCLACETAHVVADEVTRYCPDIAVELIYLDDGIDPPSLVFGVPTYVWQNRIVSLGNPHIAELLQILDEPDERGDSGGDVER
ncbi:MAG TPA: hypothetical protein VNE17_03520 [Nitrolancea sp.]|nr:hypothetical protein [Nitrolancea sp.]